MIIDASTRFPHRRADSASAHIVREFWPASEPRFAPSGPLESDAPLVAFVNENRWLVQCECGHAQYADPDDHRFFCLDCWNHATRRWRRVAWPADQAAIERVLLVRPPANRHWSASETISDLAFENLAHGLPSEPGALFATPDGTMERI